MRRGLIARSLVELPDAALEARLDRLRAAMQTAQLDALVVYTNNTRTAGVSWLTGFVPYWSEAVLVVPRTGATYLVVALSFRVKTWIERTSRIGEVFHTPRIGLKAAQQIAAAKPTAAVGIVEFDNFPVGLADDMAEGGPSLTFTDASALFSALRGKTDPAELALAVKAASIAQRSLGALQSDTLNAMIAGVEASARAMEAEEIYVAAAPDLDRDGRFTRVEGETALGRRFALRATVAYKGTWVRLVRSLGDAKLAQQGAERLAEACALLPSDRGFSGFQSWLVEGCRGTQPLDAVMSSRLATATPPPPGSVVSVQAHLTVGGQGIAVGAPALIGERGETASLLVDPSFS
jgi:Creatinase/Prolidase N-terminal domain